MGNPNEAQQNAGNAPPPDCPPPAYSEFAAPSTSMPPMAGFAPYPQPTAQATPAPAGFTPGVPQTPYAPVQTQPATYAQPAPGQPLPTAPMVVPNGATVIIQQPRFGNQPVMVCCPYCQHQGMTVVEHESGLGTWLICGGMCLFGLSLGCCLIPFCINDLKDARHKCSNCKRTIKVKKFIS